MIEQSANSKPSPWHRGEREIHARMGTVAQMEAIGQRVIRDYMPDQHRQFYQQLPFMVVGALDAHGQPWASMLEGEPGFMQSPAPQRLDIHALPGRGDPLQEAIKLGAPVGMLGIELHTRRRNRVNGNVRAVAAGFSIELGQSFGNCPQYIQKRHFSFARQPGQAYVGLVEELNELDAAARASIARADTFFVASCFPGDDEHPQKMVDVSHRGGKPGFVQIEGNTLKIPDFAGNLHFNTFGNLLLNPQAGLLFVDFETGDMLQLAGQAEVFFEAPEIAAFQGAERYWTFTVHKVVRRANALALRWRFEEFSPNSLMTGSWEQAAAKLQAQALRDAWRPFRVARIEQESSNVRSFYLEPGDGMALADFKAGQHLPIKLSLPGVERPVLRTYTLSNAPSDGFYRLSIKREGQVSRHMHDVVQVGDSLLARAPQGEFTLDALERRPAVLLAGGIGVTPMLAMLRHIVFEGLRKRRVRKTYFLYATRHNGERGFERELQELARQAGDALRIIRVVSQPEPGTEQGRDFEVQGRIDMSLLKATLGFDDYDFYLCGPQVFMQGLYDGLRGLHIADERIHAESFGPASLQRRQAGGSSTARALPPVAGKPVPVLFAESGKEARWNPDSGSLLDLAEQRGLTPEFSCRGGSCGTCRTKVLEGQVTYLNPPACKTEADEALICCALPAAGDRLVLKL